MSNNSNEEVIGRGCGCLIVVVVVLFIFDPNSLRETLWSIGSIIEFIVTWVAIIGAIIGVIYFIYWITTTYANKKKLEENKEKLRLAEESRQQEEKSRQREIKSKAKTFLKSFSKLLTECFVIDSNIWMNENYDAFFDVLEEECNKNNYTLALFGPQFDEMTNIKKSSDYGDDRNRRARIAINRIETFQKIGRLNIKPVSVDSKKGAYADPLIVKLLTTQARNGLECTFISDDKELRVRVRQHLNDNAKGTWKIVEIEDLLQGCSDVVESRKYSGGV